jgi:putative ABC transport system ATP-binding protein
MAVLTQAAARSGAALVVVTHDPTVARWCSRTVAMRDGLVSGEFFAPGRQGDAPSPAEQGGQAR